MVDKSSPQCNRDRRFRAPGSRKWASPARRSALRGIPCQGRSFRRACFRTRPRTGLSQYGFRYYIPVTGRWASRDPIGEEGGANIYILANNAAVVLIDSLGLNPLTTLIERTRSTLGKLKTEYGNFRGTIGRIFTFEKIMARNGREIAMVNLLLAESGTYALPAYPNMPFQHCVWNCRMAIVKGENYAETMSLWKEISDMKFALLGSELINPARKY